MPPCYLGELGQMKSSVPCVPWVDISFVFPAQLPPFLSDSTLCFFGELLLSDNVMDSDKATIPALYLISHYTSTPVAQDWPIVKALCPALMSAPNVHSRLKRV